MAVAIILLGLVLLVAGFVTAYAVAQARVGVPAAGWFPDPTAVLPRSRWWDSRAWTPDVRPADRAARRGRLFLGRFWGNWVWPLLGATAILIGGSAAFQSTGSVHLMALTSFLVMSGVCWAFYRFVARRLALDDVISLREVTAVSVATAGGVLLIAANINTAVITLGGLRLGTLTVGFVEEGTKLLIPLVLFTLGRYRDPRAGLAIGLGSGFGFAVVETTEYAYATVNSSGPAFCGGQTSTPTATQVIEAQVVRMLTVSPLHWLWTGLAVAVAWRVWHLYGSRGTPAALAAIVAVMVIHSLNDTSATFGCDATGVALMAQVFRWALLIAVYLGFKAMARKLTPPQLIGLVSRGWAPRNLKTRP